MNKMENQEKQNWVVAYTTQKIYKMRIIRGILEQEGIPHQTINKKETVSVMDGEVELYVLEEDQDKVKKIIEDTSFEEADK